MRLLFLYGPPASGKYTIAKDVAERSGFALFHNHLIVDAVGAVFPFGSEHFVRLREQFWLDTIRAAAQEGRSLVFTFQPESSVAPGFPERVAAIVRDAGGETVFVHLTLSLDGQLARIANRSREAFGKLRDPELLSQLHDRFAACEAVMPAAALTIDTGAVPPGDAAGQICGLLGVD